MQHTQKVVNSDDIDGDKLDINRLKNQSFVNKEQISIEIFAKLCEQKTLPENYPLALDIIQKVPIYHAKHLRLFCEEEVLSLQCKAELNHALKQGPGVIVIKGAFSDLNHIDDMSQIFDQILEEESQNTLVGDHFAKAGSNSRIWNAFEKSALKQADTFMHYYKNPLLQLVSESWLGPHYQITTQVNTVHPGGEAQSPHRDYHLGFQSTDEVSRFPLATQQSSSLLTLQGAIAHTDMPIETGPTQILPFSQHYPLGYLAWRESAFKDYFEQHAIQLPLDKGDAIFFSPALFHAAGSNKTSDQSRVANLLQISSCFAKPMETVDQYAISQSLYPVIQAHWQTALTKQEKSALLNAICDGYSFPTNLDKDAPIGGMAPTTHAQLTYQALEQNLAFEDYVTAIKTLQFKRTS